MRTSPIPRAGPPSRRGDRGRRPAGGRAGQQTRGCRSAGEFLDADLERLQTELDVNVSAVLRMTHLALSGMVARGHGAVVLVSSFAGILPARGSAYGASRAWAVALADTVAPSLRGTGTQITVVCPGFVRTASLHAVPRDASFRQRFLLLAPDEVARRALADLRAGRGVRPRGRLPRRGRARCNGSRPRDIPPVDLRLAPLQR